MLDKQDSRYLLMPRKSKNKSEDDSKAIRVEVSFGKSTSQNYKKAVKLAKEFEGYTAEGEGTRIRHRVNVDLTLDEDQTWARFANLAQTISGWRSTNIALNGEYHTTIWSLQREMDEIKRCFNSRRSSPLGDAYCLGQSAENDDPSCFGCRFVKVITYGRRSEYQFYGAQKWYQYGTLSADHKLFHVDKKRIRELVREHTEGHMCTRCPFFAWDRIERAVSDLPSVIELEHSAEYEVKYSEVTPGKALGIQPKRRDDDYPVSLTIGFDRDQLDESDQNDTRNVPSVRYSDVAAQDHALEEIRNVVELPLTHPEYFEQLGVEPQRGIILHGTPGNGKTLIAKAVATESNAHLEIINGPEIVSKWVGESENNLRRAFRRAAKCQPSIVLIDELDAIAPRRADMTHQHEVSLISQLLVILDGLDDRGRVAVIGTTNRIEAIDEALRRPGRFDYHIRVVQPDENGRASILKVHLGKMKLSSDVDILGLAQTMDGFSGAEIAAVCREAGLVAIRNALQRAKAATDTCVTNDDLLVGLVRIRGKRV